MNGVRRSPLDSRLRGNDGVGLWDGGAACGNDAAACGNDAAACGNDKGGLWE